MSKKIMVVDDDREMGRLLRTLFEMEGYQVSVVPVYEEILSTARQVMPDIVLMDVRLRGKETVDLMRQMRADVGLKRIPVVMTSGMDLGRECMEAGAKLFVLKPFLPDELVRTVGRLIE
jgi:DNA-binding response OmpR family regulator